MLNVKYFEKFIFEENVILIWGTNNELLDFAQNIFKFLGFNFKKRDGEIVTFVQDIQDCDVILDNNIKSEICDVTIGISEAVLPCHNYINYRDCCFIISIGEYPESFPDCELPL